ncbi:MAG: hypothetical protein Q7S75_03160 [bacterium]|nr:hypothetical protein [bacterium]
MLKTPRKVCFVFQRRFTCVAHKIAIELREKHGVSEFCGYVYLRSSAKFLRNQKDIPYGKLLVDEEIHDASAHETVDWKDIEELEREYGIPNLWPYLAVDRVIRYGMGVREYPHDTSQYTHETMARMLQATVRAILKFLEQEKPDVIFMPVVSSLGNMLLFHIAKKKGIPVLVGAETRIDGGYILSEDYHTFSFANARFKQLMEGAKSLREIAARAYLEEYRVKPRTYLYYMEGFKNSGARREAFSWLSPQKIVRSIQWLSLRILRTTLEPAHDYMEQSPWWFLLDATRRKFRLMRGFADLWDESNPQEQFAYYPLHVEPEMATLLLAPRWTNQINLIKQIAESLPLSFKLYVKEHPVMVGFRPRQYYRELKKIPNVKLIHPNHDSHALIKSAKLIATITGTVGWEAVLLGKPVITFGNVYYNALGAVKKCNDIEELPALVKERLERFVPNDTELISFIAALLENSENLRLHELWEKGTGSADPETERASISGFCELFMRYARS